MPARDRLTIVVGLLLAIPPGATASDLKFGSRFGDAMVVQRDRPIVVTGEAAPGASVAIEFGPTAASTTAGPDGRWTARLAPLPAGGPHPMTARAGGATARLGDILIGDVWLCSGQSNMQMTLKESDGGPALAEAAPKRTSLRLATVGRRSSGTPESTGEVRWRAASRESARDFSAVGYAFANALLADESLAGVPLGVIDCSFGGSMCEAWIPAEALAGFDKADLRGSMFGAGPSGYYNGMVAPLGRSPIKGAVWYQGESNADRPATYARLLSTLIASWRARFETPDLPFIIIGLPDWAAGAGGLSWAWIREAQAEAARATPHTSLALGIETTDGTDLHPVEKAELGRRAALRALRDVYGRPVVAEGPRFVRATPEGGSLRVHFDPGDGGDGLVSRDGRPIRGFAVAGTDGRHRHADASIEGSDVILKAGGVPEPATVRHAWSGVPGSNLGNRAGLPAAPFRTDTLPIADADVQRVPTSRQVKTRGYELTIDGKGSVTSLGVGGRQFISNGLGLAGGTGVPTFFGPRNLTRIDEPGPGLVSCGDDVAGVLFEFAERSSTWTIANRGKDEMGFRIVLAPGVTVDGRPGSAQLTLRRGRASLTIDGVETVTASDDGPILELKIPGKATKRLVLGFEAP